LPYGGFLTALGFVIVFCQIALGGWVSSNYAGIACIGFPQCNGLWIVPLHLERAFNLFSQSGANYQGGLLDNDIRAAIQVIHRFGAYVTVSYVVVLSVWILKHVRQVPQRFFAIFAMVLVLMQCVLGVLNVIYLLPLWIAVAHNGVAALLLTVMVSQCYLASTGARNAV